MAEFEFTVDVNLEEMAKQVKAARAIIDDVSAILEDAARSVVIEVVNVTTCKLRFVGRDISHGALEVFPDTIIQPFSPNVFGARSSSGAIATGTEGIIRYAVDDAGTEFHVRWDNPFSGANEAQAFMGGPNKDLYSFSYMITGGNKKVPARFVIGEKALLREPESAWITCDRCKALYYAPGGSQGACPPTKHTGEVTINFDDGTWISAQGDVWDPHKPIGWILGVPYGQYALNRSEGWRRCQHCKMLYWDGVLNDSRGVCPSGYLNSPHAHAPEGESYLLPYDVKTAPGLQNDWRFCEKCFVLFFEPHDVDNSCAAGGRHRPTAHKFQINLI
ncbi:hypothetical protein ACFV9E_30400 [Streptomyces sp. NPDC059835]|uniref:hypothetical protein n=1 Tax=Streptomyces sp. NPDC059835 TaxID=3346967 RepID=UPI00364EE5E9